MNTTNNTTTTTPQAQGAAPEAMDLPAAGLAEPDQSVDFERRFGGIARLYGSAGLARFRAAHVCVIGVGGVGSWIVEALARSAIGQLTLIDLDNVAESNITARFRHTPHHRPAQNQCIGRTHWANQSLLPSESD